jgi:hypothetical protein
MSPFKDITGSLVDLYTKLAIKGKRTALVTRLRIELSGLDKQRMELYARLGEHLDELRRVDQINDPGLLALLEGEFMSLDRLKLKIDETMNHIRDINLDGGKPEGSSELVFDENPSVESQNLIDSFDVL